jgi:mono/diheme cytochrome c family protein
MPRIRMSTKPDQQHSENRGITARCLRNAGLFTPLIQLALGLTFAGLLQGAEAQEAASGPQREGGKGAPTPAMGAISPNLLTFARTEFANTCARCHNSDGMGNIAMGIPSFADARWQDQHPDAELKAAITNGLNNRMPPFGAVYSSAQIDALVTGVIRPLRDASVQPDQRLTEEELHPIPVENRLPAPGHGRDPIILGSVGMYTQHNDNGRTGANLAETTLNPGNVRAGRFGLLFRHDVDDQVFAQPLYVPNLAVAGGRHNVVIVATAANTLYAFDADRDGKPYWKVNLGTPGSVQLHHCWCLDILGNMGIIGTPVIDPAAGSVYVVALSYEKGGFVQRLHALDIATGAERQHSPVIISTDGFDPVMENQRPALLLLRGSVYVGYASHCDMEPYHGYLFRFDSASLQQTGVINLSPGAQGNSIWQSGQGPAADAKGDIYIVTSNGTWDGERNLSDSFMRLNRELAVQDWFTPTNYPELDRRDWDLNSSGAMLIPGTNEVMGVGKEGIGYVVNRSNFGHLGDEHATQYFRIAKGEVNVGPVYWNSSTRGALVYVWGQDDALKSYRFKEGRFETTPWASGSAASSYPGGILSVSANGGTGGILWANASLTEHGNGHINSPGVLRAYDANDVSHELWNSNIDAAHDTCGRISKNAPPTVVNGKVYLASFGSLPVGTGSLYVYGLLPEPSAQSELPTPH